MPQLELTYLILFVAFVLPGAISMYIYGLLVPQAERLLKEKVLEAVCFSLINFVLLFWLIRLVLDPAFLESQALTAWLIVIVAFIVLPLVWPFAAVRLLTFFERRGWIKVRARTAWDDYFGRLSGGCWILVELVTGKLVGGRFSVNSFASAFPEPGHLYIEQLWELDDDGAFVAPLPGSPGILLRPSDYRHVKVFSQ